MVNAITEQLAAMTIRDNDVMRCDWCNVEITDLWEAFQCMNSCCDKVVCGRKGCSSMLAYFTCCEDCEEEACDSEDEEDETTDGDSD